MIVDYIPASVETDVLICAIHASVEPGTAEVARAIHTHCRGSVGLYICYGDRHITSHQFNEPLFNTVVGQYRRVISIHGMDAITPIVWVGGRDTHLVQQLRTAMGLGIQHPPKHLRGIHPTNVVNRGSSHKGVQLEIAWIHLNPKSPLRDWVAQITAQTLLRC
jgi:phage replication-related protein YjqB (UPF0714/DUF867 family)